MEGETRSSYQREETVTDMKGYARAVQKELGWSYQRSRNFIVAFMDEARDMAKEDGIKLKEALFLMAHAREESYREDAGEG